jgi:hypothetical protein
MTSTTSEVVRIPAINLPRLQEEVEAMSRRSAKLGLAPLVLNVVKMEQEKRIHPSTKVEYVVEYAHVSITGESPILNGWGLVARKTPVVTGEGSEQKVENLVQCVPGQSCPVSYRFTGMECDHCRTARRRNDTFILKHESGKFAQVGRNCISDFLGHQSPESMLNAAEWVFSGGKLLEEAGEESWGFKSGPFMVDIGLFLAVTAVVIRKMGWVSKGDAYESEGTKTATAGIAWDVAARPNDQHVKEMVEKFDLHAEEKDGQLAEAALAWARAIPTTERDYLYNLGVQARRVAIDWKGTGLVASAITAYQRHLEREREAQEKAQAPAKARPAHVGQVGIRQGFSALTVKALRSFESEFGVRTLVRFNDLAGNTLVWWASGEAPDWAEENAQVDLTATVKAHEDYKGWPQTVLTRCSLGLPKPKGGKKSKKEQGQADDAAGPAAA